MPVAAAVLAAAVAGELMMSPANAATALPTGTGKATSEIFATRVSVGTDFEQYGIFG